MKHYLVMLSSAPNRPDEFRATCGYTSTDSNEFTKITDPSIKGVTCAGCLEKLSGAVVIVRVDETKIPYPDDVSDNEL